MKCKQVFKNNGCMSESTDSRDIRLLFDGCYDAFVLCLFVLLDQKFDIRELAHRSAAGQDGIDDLI